MIYLPILIFTVLSPSELKADNDVDYRRLLTPEGANKVYDKLTTLIKPNDFPKQVEREYPVNISEKCNCSLTKNFNPVCGNDQITYPNPSYLFCVAECENPALEYSYCGVCLEENMVKPRDKSNIMSGEQRKLSQELLDTLSKCDCVITYNFNPICGNDGVTYPNPSMLYCIKQCIKRDLKIKSCGSCNESVTLPPKLSDAQIDSKFSEATKICLKKCPVVLNVDPVCGTNGYTYDSSEELTCYNECTNENVNIKYRGTCEQKCDCQVTDDVDNVCADDNINYANPATMYCAGKCRNVTLAVSHWTKCDIKLNINQTDIESDQNNLQIVELSDELSSKFELCGCNYIKEYAPVCGSDGTTYDNPSIIYCTQKCTNPELTIKYSGICKIMKIESKLKTTKREQKEINSLSNPFIKCDCVATSALLPICGSNGITYPHPSYLYCMKDCKAKDKSLQNVEMLHCGTCYVNTTPKEHSNDKLIELSNEMITTFEKCNCNVTKKYIPVCATNGITYDNPSIFYCAKKCINKDIHIHYCGNCSTDDTEKQLTNNFSNDDINKCHCIAPRDYEPVCGSDGNNYANPKVFECAKNCIDKSMSIAYNGLCNDENQDLSKTIGRKIRSTDVEPYVPPLCQNCLFTYEAYQPVCGTDGYTYPSRIKMYCIARCLRSSVEVAYDKPCDSSLSNPGDKFKHCCTLTSDEYSPICGSDGVTYKNLAYLTCTNVCENKSVIKLYNGQCYNPINN